MSAGEMIWIVTIHKTQILTLFKTKEQAVDSIKLTYPNSRIVDLEMDTSVVMENTTSWVSLASIQPRIIHDMSIKLYTE